MAMKKVKLDLFFLWKDKTDNLFEAEQLGKEDSTTIEDECDGKTNHPVDIQLFEEECNQNNGGQE